MRKLKIFCVRLRRNVIARAYVKRLLEGPNLQYGDSKDLTNFAREIEECLVSLTHLNYFSDINSFENMARNVRRLPSSLQNRWLRFSSKTENEKKGSESCFSNLQQFVSNEAKIAKSLYAAVLQQKGEKTSNFSNVFTHSTSVSEAKRQSFVNKNCWFCNAEHKLWDCPQFTQKSLTDRIQFIRRNHLCDNCAKKGHVANYCFSKSACKVTGCKQKHNFSLHRTKPPATNSTSSTNTLAEILSHSQLITHQ